VKLQSLQAEKFSTNTIKISIFFRIIAMSDKKNILIPDSLHHLVSHLLAPFLIILLLQLPTEAQNATDRAYILKHTNVEKLRQKSEKAKNRFNEIFTEKKRAAIALTIKDRKNRTGYLAKFDKNGNPVYHFDGNKNAAITSRINSLFSGGSLNLDLDGKGIEIGHWEAGGLARLSHQELKGRVTHAENYAESNHSTHTSCTMIGTGIDPAARGMAPAATIVSRQSGGDEGEMADFAADGGIISNHSYYVGDPGATTSGYGRYDDNAYDFDEVMYNAPYYLICELAGNALNDDVNSGDDGFDLVFGYSSA
jgi:hypothetical protein